MSFPYPRLAGPLRPPLLATRCFQRGLVGTAQRPATVADPGAASASSSSSTSQTSSSASHDAAPLRQSIYGSKELLEAKKAKKFAEYERLLSEKAKREGYGSVAEMRAKQEELKSKAIDTTQSTRKASAEAHRSGMTEADAKVAAEIRRRAEAEAERKIKSGNFTSGPGIKSLSDIIDVGRLESDSASKISQLWTQYHTLKNKISAVIPAKQYAEMVQKARRYPQFLLPLPRTIVGSLEGDQTETANVGPGEQKQGFEMQYMQWSFLPPPPVSTVSGGQEEVTDLTSEDKQLLEKTVPTTVLFTPLAEYKLRQEYAQPVLILTHYTDLALSKGIVLLRGEVTGAEEAAVPTAGIMAATAASQAGETSAEKLERLKKPVQSQGKLSAQDAQLLTVTLQRFYMPKVAAAAASALAGDKERQELLNAFHNDQGKFDIDRLCTYSLMT